MFDIIISPKLVQLNRFSRPDIEMYFYEERTITQGFNLNTN